ncbi:MAG: ABC transporter ATP-binding protein [Bacteroidia bacterium]|nr:ABC transporter ATP-binding protein [Bacteroidia bacterium]
MLKATNIQKSYGTLHVLRSVSLELFRGQVVCLVGSSGAGKSTLLQIMGTLDDADSGEIWFHGEPIHQMSQDQKAKFRNQNIGFVFQFHHLLPELTALENVCLPAWIAGEDKLRVEKKAKELLSYFHLQDRISHKPTELSGGEQQRVAVARALINEPAVLLADEPTGNLDSNNSQLLFNLLYQLAAEKHIACLVVTHNDLFAQTAHRMLRMKDGQIL